jgi:hypothetical protein
LDNKWIGELDALVAVRDGFPSPEIAAQVAATMVTGPVSRQPWPGDMESWASRALSQQGPGTFTVGLQTRWALVCHGVYLGDAARAAAAHLISVRG